jgi:hypothetical protein
MLRVLGRTVLVMIVGGLMLTLLIGLLSLLGARSAWGGHMVGTNLLLASPSVWLALFFNILLWLAPVMLVWALIDALVFEPVRLEK